MSTLLIVDDEPANRRLLQAILKPEGYAIEQASSGYEALDLIARGGIDLVVLDVMMPGIDGIEICRQLRERKNYVPVILVTALADQQSRLRGKQAGADDFLTKPVHEDELIVRVRNLLRIQALHEEALHEAERWRLMSDVATAVATCVDYRCLLHKLMTSLARAVPVDCAGILDHLDGGLVVRSTCGHEIAGTVRLELTPQDRDWVEQLSRTGHARVSQTIASPLLPMLQMLGFAEGIAIAVLGAGVLHQVFVVAREGTFSDDDVRCLTQIAPHIGTAVNNVRLHMRSEQLLKSRDELSQLIVHDLRNLLASAHMNLEMLTETPDLEDRDEALLDALHSVQRMSGLVAELLDVGAAEEGRLQIHREPTDLARLATEVLAHSVPKLGEHPERARLIVTGDAPVTAAVDVRLTRRVLENVVGNARRFVGEHGMIEVHVERVGDQAMVAISNDGPKIDPEVRARMFDKYMGQGTRPSGTRGLGLYFCRLVMEAHAGSIRVADPPTGARFELVLPLG